MAEYTVFARQTVPPAPADTQAAPLLYLSSAEAGWEGLRANAFYEPKALESWIAPSIPETALILFAGGPMCIEQRQSNGPWQTTHVRQQGLILRPGSGPGAEVRWRSLSSAPTRTLHLHVSRDLLARTAAEIAGEDSTDLTVVARSGFHDPLLAQIGFALWQELEHRTPAGKLYAETAGHLLALHLLRHYTSRTVDIPAPAGGLSRRHVRRVTDFVRANVGQEVSLAAMAQEVGFSPYHFARLFRQTMGESPHQYVVRERVEHAQRLLRGTDLPLGAIALASGFAHQSHLTRIFSRRVGLTPRAYRRETASRARLCQDAHE